MIDSALEQKLIQFQSDGYCLLPDVIPPGECTSIRERISRAVQRERENYPGAPTKVGFTPSIINHDQSFASYLAHDELLALMQRILGPHIRISFTSAIINEPGNERGNWHADWPFNQKNAGHIPAPYPNIVMHITTLWMLSPFSVENGGTLIIPNSHHRSTNPTAGDEADSRKKFPLEKNVTGPAGCVLIMDSRLWHATAPNQSTQPRVALAVRYAPWWLNLEVLRPDSGERKRICDESGKTDNIVPSIRREVYDHLPDQVKPLYRHWVEPNSKEMG